MRDLVNGKRRFKDFLDSPERIASNILTARLAAMVESGLVTSRLYLHRPRRYEYRLTKKGAALLPVLQEFCRWGERYLPNRWHAPAAFMSKRPTDLMAS